MPACADGLPICVVARMSLWPSPLAPAVLSVDPRVDDPLPVTGISSGKTHDSPGRGRDEATSHAL